MPIEDLASAIAERINYAEAEIAALESARGALLGNGGAPARPHRSGRRKSTKAAAASAETPPSSEPAGDTTPPPSEAEPGKQRASRAPQSRRKSAGRAPAGPAGVLLAGKLEAMLGSADGGLPASVIATAAEARPAQVRGLLQDLERNGQVRRTGRGRGTRWRLVSDEERIAERAAELEGRSKTRRPRAGAKTAEKPAG